jgi:hypothetical protein
VRASAYYMCPHTTYVSSYYYILLLQVADMSLVAYAGKAQDESAEARVRAAFKQLPQGTPYATSACGLKLQVYAALRY